MPSDYIVNCGACWAIVSIQNTESMMLIETRKYTPLSAQQLTDCCSRSGFSWDAFQYMVENGLTCAQDYPLNNDKIPQGPCMAAGKPIALHVQGWEKFQGVDHYWKAGIELPRSVEDVFEEALFKSPLDVFFHTNDFFENFKGKFIIKYHQCPPPKNSRGCNHRVSLVGFGCDKKRNRCWIIQNVWGPGWGDKGFAKIRRGTFRGFGNEKSLLFCKYNSMGLEMRRRSSSKQPILPLLSLFLC